MDVMNEYMKLVGVIEEDAEDGARWRLCAMLWRPLMGTGKGGAGVLNLLTIMGQKETD